MKLKFIYIRLTTWFFTWAALLALIGFSGKLGLTITMLGTFSLYLLGVLAAFFILWLLSSIFWKRSFEDYSVDERIKLIESNSARNGFLASFLALVATVALSSGKPIESGYFFLIFGFSLLVFIVSFIIYFYKKD
jgi:hypothetical protein